MSASSEQTGSERPCGLSFLLPIGMSCRGRAETFAKRLQSRLRTLGTQETSPLTVTNGTSENSWLTQNEQQQITHIQPLRNLTQEADSFFDFDIDGDNESPGSPVDECEYSRLIETQSNTPHDVAPESGYVCASPISPEGSLESQSSSDGPYFDPESSDAEQRSLTSDYFDCIENKKDSSSSTISQSTMPNGHMQTIIDSDSCSESLPPSQSTDTCTAPSSASNSTLQDVTGTELESSTLTNTREHEKLENNVEENHIGEKFGIENHSTAKCNGEIKLIPNGHIHQVSSLLELSSIEVDKQLILECIQSPETENSQPDYDEVIIIHEPTDTEISEATLEVNLDNNSIGSTDNELPNEHHLFVSVDDDDGDENSRPQRIRRCSSLKTGKTPPGTPGRKKIVRFADVLGLDLADVRTFLDEIPKIPKSAFDDLENFDIELQHQTLSLGPRTEKMLIPLFQQPASLPNFLEMVRDKQVCMENAAVTDPTSLTITGCVRVRNLDFNKSVHVRYTLNSWQSFSDLKANYVQNSCDGFSDKFSFILFGNSLHVGQRIEMAVRFHCKGQQFWDNNYGQNYVFQCLPTSQPVLSTRPLSHTTDETWCRSFY